MMSETETQLAAEELPPIDYEALLKKLLDAAPETPTRTYCCDDADGMRRVLQDFSDVADEVEKTIADRAQELKRREAEQLLKTPPTTWETMPTWLLAVSPDEQRLGESRRIGMEIGDDVFVSNGVAAAGICGAIPEELNHEITCESALGILKMHEGADAKETWVSLDELRALVANPEAPDLAFGGSPARFIRILDVRLSVALVVPWVISLAALAGDTKMRASSAGPLSALVCTGTNWTSAVMPLRP